MLYPDFAQLIALKQRKSKIPALNSRVVMTARQGNHFSPFRGQGLEFDAVREYVPGDDIRSIDWRVTARTGLPHLKIFKEDRERHITICVDMNASMRFGTRQTFKSVQAAQVAALLGWQGIKQHDRVNGCLFGDVQHGVQFFSPKQSKHSFYAMLKTLAQPAVHDFLVPLQQPLQQLCRNIATGSLVYIISDFLGLDFHFQEEKSLSLLRRNCHIVLIAINDPLDKAIPFAETVVFSSEAANSKAAKKMMINTQDTAGQAAYAEAWKKDRERLYEMTTKYKIPLVELTTESELPKDLFYHLKKAVKGRSR